MENAHSLEIQVGTVSKKIHIIIIHIHILPIIQKQYSNSFIYLYYSTIYYL